MSLTGVVIFRVNSAVSRVGRAERANDRRPRRDGTSRCNEEGCTVRGLKTRAREGVVSQLSLSSLSSLSPSREERKRKRDAEERNLSRRRKPRGGQQPRDRQTDGQAKPIKRGKTTTRTRVQDREFGSVNGESGPKIHPSDIPRYYFETAAAAERWRARGVAGQ